MEDDEVMALLNANQRTLTANQLTSYVDGAFVTLSNVPEFTYLLPGMLSVWSQEIFNPAPSAFTERFHSALGQRYEGVTQLAPSFITTQLAPPLKDVVVQFMRQVLLQRIGAESLLSIPGVHASRGYLVSEEYKRVRTGTRP